MNSVDCDDEDPCTQDVCMDDTCEHHHVDGMCSTGTCVKDELEGRSETVCAESVASENVALCTNSTCTGTATEGCDIGFTFGTGSVATEVDQDDVRTTILSIPVTQMDFVNADLMMETSNCLATISIEEGAPLMIEVTIVTESAATCGGEETVVAREVDTDLSNLVLAVTAGEGEASLCAGANAQFAPDGIYRSEAELAVEEWLLAAFGSIEDALPIGTSCGSCSGECEGLSCGPGASDN
jgi:hypothetical protein